MRKPRLFVASSAESLPVAEAFNVNLDHDLEVTLWKVGTFELSSSTIDDLVKKSSAVDFALFIFTADDTALIRGVKLNVVRDNVLFELGLFIGAIGKDRCFIIKPRSLELHFPTDLLGVNTEDYDAERSDGDLVSATNRASTLIKQAIATKGLLDNIGVVAREQKSVNPESYALSPVDVRVLIESSVSHTNNPAGISFGSIQYSLKRLPETEVRVGIIKLERLGYVEKSIEIDNRDGDVFFAYKITEDGINAMLRHMLTLNAEETKIAATAKKSGYENLPDDIPF